MNNDSVAAPPQEAPQTAFKGNPVDKFPLTRDRTLITARCGRGVL